MNVRAIANAATRRVNPNSTILLYRSLDIPNEGYGTTSIAYSAPETIKNVQVQPVKSGQLEHIANYNQSSTYRVFYWNGSGDGLNRIKSKGGDLIVWDNEVWLIVNEPEDFHTTSEWIQVIGQAQPDSPENVYQNALKYSIEHGCKDAGVTWSTP